MSFTITSKDKNSRARTGILRTPHGDIETPAYIIVGTHAEVRTLTPEDLKKTKTQVIIANTYHLWQKLWKSDLHNIEGQTFPGLHTHMNWNGPIMTDSGGFQVFSLGFAREHRVGKIANIFPSEEKKQQNQCLLTKRVNIENIEQNLVEITKEGAYFTTEQGENGDCSPFSPIPSAKREGIAHVHKVDQAIGGKQFLGPKESIRIQERLGADIILAFDECTSPLNDYEYTKEALKRTHAWEKICLETKTRKDQLLFGIVQGGEYEDLREESAKYIGSLPFDGLAIGGSLGKSKKDMWNVLHWTIPLLPEERPRHLLGIGQIEDIFNGVERGVDMFDCVIPTREARHGRLWTASGHFDIMKGNPSTTFFQKVVLGKFAKDTGPLDKTCACETCATTTKKELHERFKSKDKNAAHLATIHNVFFFNNLMSQIRSAIKENKFQKLKQKLLSD